MTLARPPLAQWSWEAGSVSMCQRALVRLSSWQPASLQWVWPRLMSFANAIVLSISASSSSFHFIGVPPPPIFHQAGYKASSPTRADRTTLRIGPHSRRLRYLSSRQSQTSRSKTPSGIIENDKMSIPTSAPQADQVNASESRPEQSRTRPATVTLRKL